MGRLWRLLGWFLGVEALMTIFGPMTAPLLLSLAADSIVGLLIIRYSMDMLVAITAPDIGTPLPLLFRRCAAILKHRRRRRDY